ncbi:hypothetical protein M378DRAFT_10173 [Amanita muscaria Koide BX008]|uniref:Uncharacterized protein n=1 Tax=Amanita muscaria (strain Koide BX008) TaxID=946122 RepID=A0A0C2XB32_AMAMK|nr:hypothetical protein M378DRAFT_10173 [Amanita muscaria Koide BX008]
MHPISEGTRTILGTADTFIIIVEDVDVLFHDSFVSRLRHAEDEHNAMPAVPDVWAVLLNYYISIVSDRWLYAHMRQPIPFKFLVLCSLTCNFSFFPPAQQGMLSRSPYHDTDQSKLPSASPTGSVQNLALVVPLLVGEPPALSHTGSGPWYHLVARWENRGVEAARREEGREHDR